MSAHDAERQGAERQGAIERPGVATPEGTGTGGAELGPASRLATRAPLGPREQFTSATAPRPLILAALEAATRAAPLERKRLVGPDVNYGRELLRTLARATGGWIGWEATHLYAIATELAFVPLAERGMRAGSDVEIDALVQRALDRALELGRVSAGIAALEQSLSLRAAMRSAIQELRLAGVSARQMPRASGADRRLSDLTAVLEIYERLLDETGLADAAGLFRLALERFDREAPYVLDGLVFLAPGVIARGLPGALASRLIAAGARVLAGDAPVGLTPPATVLAHRASRDPDIVRHGDSAPRRTLLAWSSAGEIPARDEPAIDRSAVTVDCFAAATPTDELREVCRRVMGEGLRWDDVEIVATDADTYGIALDALCQQLGCGATMLHGLPLARTRLGRALERWLAWLGDGLPADVLRQALEAGELHVPDMNVAPASLARELRALRIGWGRARYEAALATLESGVRAATLVRREGESDEELEARREAQARTGAALAALLRALLACTPEVPERGSLRPVRASCASLARATLGWLALVPLHGMPEQQTASRLTARLEELAAVGGEEVGFASALAALREGIGDLRAWPLVTDERKPWSASGGMLHLTDLAHAGTTGRTRIFVVGLDADRAPGQMRQDPLLADEIRIAIARSVSAPGVLATSAERHQEAAYTLATALATLRGRVTLSYATGGSVDGRETGPAAAMLEVWRLVRGDRTLSYEALREALAPPAAALPMCETGEPEREGADGADGANGAPERALRQIELLDARDVWLHAISEGALLLDGDRLVRGAFPEFDAGLRAAELAAAAALTPYHGLVPRAAGVLDPTARAGAEISPSALERLARCPLAWFYRYGLGLIAPDDPEYDPGRWLDALQRGSLLHRVLEDFVREHQGRQAEIASDAAETRILALVDAAVAEWRQAVPPPGETILEAEAQELRSAALAFLSMERTLAAKGDRGEWKWVEYPFGGGEPPGHYRLTDGRTIAVRGRADRIDLLPDGSLRVIDYKTGRSSDYTKQKGGPFNGGRHLQPALYAAAVSERLGATVSCVQYRFPTERGGNAIVSYAASELNAARPIIDGLLEHVHEGMFVPTTESVDCTICDFQPICRVARDARGFTVRSPRAAWAKAHATTLDAYRTMLARRGAGAEGPGLDE
jgi:ATP-dependent helicase/nuclease subunit B